MPREEKTGVRKMEKNSTKEIKLEKVLIENLSEHICIRIHKINPEDNFMEDICPLLHTELEKSHKNKNSYFISEITILLCSGFSGFFSALGANEVFYKELQAVFGIIASILSASITFLIGIRGLKKWQETWLRHRGYLNKCYEECYFYANNIGKYKSYQPAEYETQDSIFQHTKQYEKEQLDIFKEAIISILIQNNQTFMKNMRTQEKEEKSEN